MPKLLQALIDEATDNGVTLTGIYTSKANITKMRSNAAIQKAVNGNVGAGALVRADAFNAYLNEEFGIQRVIANDLTYAVENGVGANGRPNRTTKRYYPKDKITLFAANPSGRLGEGLWGDPPETDAGAFMQVGASGVSRMSTFRSGWRKIRLFCGQRQVRSLCRCFTIRTACISRL